MSRPRNRLPVPLTIFNKLAWWWCIFMYHIIWIIQHDVSCPDLYAIVLILALHLDFIQYNLNSNSFIKSYCTWNITIFLKYYTIFVVMDWIIASWNRNSFSLGLDLPNIYVCIIFSTSYPLHFQWVRVCFSLLAKLW